MKCAMEIMMMKENAEKIYAAEQARLDEMCRINHVQIIAATITFCEEVIGAEFEKLANSRRDVYHCTRGVIEQDRLGNEIFHPLCKEVGCRYANGEDSYSPNYNIAYDVATLNAYLSQYCYTVNWSTAIYKKYGSGAHYGKKLEVKI